MLNFDIKRKINTLRDILVGKVPDPKAQVEQITIALIYKFMDDMDLQGAEWGDREFFTEEFEKYAWSNIMQSTNSGQERAYLYAEGIERMATNSKLPQLFRDIFKNAYIPYRDPDTLNMFLKEISEFSYDNSEDLGNAFEYLLSIMGSQGDAGQFRTPRHIIDMMVDIIDPKKEESILDPSCGTAGFLISSYKHILENNRDEQGKSSLTADDRKRMTTNFAGYDISPDMVRLARVNMYLHKFTKPKISEYDTLTSEEKWDDSFDVILANPPFMTPKGGIQPHKRYRVQAKRSEVLFVDYIAEHLNATGRAAVIVPEGIVFQSAIAYKNLRKYLIEDYLLYAVISLPSGVFNPYSGVKTSILLFDKALSKQKDKILFVKMDNDGYDLGAQRREIKGSNIPEILNILKAYQKGEDIESSLTTFASREDIAKQDYVLVGERYKVSAKVNSKWDMVRLGDVCEVQAGGTPLRSDDSYWDCNDFPWYTSGELNEMYTKEPQEYISSLGLANSSVKLFPKGSLLVGMYDTAAFKMSILDREATFNQAICGIKPNKNINMLFLMFYFKAHKERYLRMRVGARQRNLTKQFISELCIPLPSLSLQEEIVTEIEGYQKIIDGAKMIVDNYKPTIKIDPSWKMLKLGVISEINQRTTVPCNDFIYLDISSVENGTGKIDYTNILHAEEAPSRARRVVKNSSILLSTVRPNLQAFAYIESSKVNRCIASTGFAVLDASDACLPKFLYYSLFQNYIANQMESAMGKGAYPSINQKDVENLNIALPPLETQKEIVEKINEEIAVVEQNKRLIEIFEQKIKDKISEVWGE